MKLHSKLHLIVAAALTITLAARPALAQHDHHHDDSQEKPASAKADLRVGDPYPFDTCPVTGKKLGAMGDPISKLYDGREVRFCCPSCPPKFEKDKATSLGKLDEKIIKDQASLYPLKTSVVTGKDLPEKPYEFVLGNRLIRLGLESERTDFSKDPQKFLALLDKETIAAQVKKYPLAKCPVSGDELGGDMGKPVDVVVAARLIRLCCKDCRKDVEKDPAKFIAAVDAARKEKEKPHDHDHSAGDGHKEHGK